MIQFDKTTIVRMIYCIGVLAVGKLVTYIEYKYFATINLIKKTVPVGCANRAHGQLCKVLHNNKSKIMNCIFIHIIILRIKLSLNMTY